MGIFDKVFGNKNSGNTGTRCYKCGKQLGNVSGGIYSGSGLASGLLQSPYDCKSCGTLFCVDCMTKLRKGPCPHCGKDIGW